MNNRKADYPIDKIFINRWSPRAMSGQPISESELMSLFEAARWAPSSYNNQPWRFIYARRGSQYWDRFFNFLLSGNQKWAKNAAALMVVISHNTFSYNGKPSRTHTFDAGAAAENLALQASIMGLVCHGMEGFDYDRVKKELEIPDDYTVEAMFALGKPGNPAELDPELAEREQPSLRMPVKEFAFEGSLQKRQQP